MKSERHLDGAASAPAWPHLWAWFIWLALALAVVTVPSACATGPRLVAHAFNFDGRKDGWHDQVDLLAYSYGDQYHMVQNSIDSPRSMVFEGRPALPSGTGVNGSMPVGDHLYVKWRVKATGDVMEEWVDLRSRLPDDMTDHELTFVIDGRQLYVYVVTPERKKAYAEPPVLRTWRSRFAKAYEIYPAPVHR